MNEVTKEYLEGLNGRMMHLYNITELLNNSVGYFAFKEESIEPEIWETSEEGYKILHKDNLTSIQELYGHTNIAVFHHTEYAGDELND